MRTIETPASPRARVLGFLDAFQKAPNDADIEISLGMDEAQRPALLISVGRSNHCLLVTEARKVADIMEEAMRANPNDPEARTLPNTIMGIRAACQKADRGFAANG